MTDAEIDEQDWMMLFQTQIRLGLLDLVSSWEFARTTREPHSVIRVKNLQNSLAVGKDAWGRKDLLQPVLISASVSLSSPFESASAGDTVNNSTINYGTLSKRILSACQQVSNKAEAIDEPITLMALLNGLFFHLVQHGTYRGGKSLSLRLGAEAGTAVDSLELRVMLPKASLMGSGVSHTIALGKSTSGYRVCTASSLRLHDLRVSALIGINPNERLARQTVIANVEVDHWYEWGDEYNSLEQIIVKVTALPQKVNMKACYSYANNKQTIEETSFETLEALAACIGRRVFRHWLKPRISNAVNHGRLRICLEKPTAVIFADAPAVEILLDTDRSETTKALWNSIAGIEKDDLPRVEYPLETSLQEWITKCDPNGND